MSRARGQSHTLANPVEYSVAAQAAGRGGNIFDFEPLRAAHADLVRWIDARLETPAGRDVARLKKMRNQLSAAEGHGYLSYARFNSILMHAAFAAGGERLSRIDERVLAAAMKGPGTVVPIVKDGVMGQEELIKYWAAGIYPVQLISDSTVGDGRVMSIGQFLMHDFGHAADSMRVQRELRGRRPKSEELRGRLRARMLFFSHLFSQVEQLEEPRRSLTKELLFVLMHEGVPTPDGDIMSCSPSQWRRIFQNRAQRNEMVSILLDYQEEGNVRFHNERGQIAGALKWISQQIKAP